MRKTFLISAGHKFLEFSLLASLPVLYRDLLHYALALSELVVYTRYGGGPPANTPQLPPYSAFGSRYRL